MTSWLIALAHETGVVIAAPTPPIPFPRPAVAMRLDVGALPTPPTSIIGREREVGDVLALIDRGDLRVLTLLGPGGVGKTRLALEIGGRIAASFAHGAAFVPLETVHDPGLVAASVANALGLQESPDRPTTEAIIDQLADQHMLLILDNFEQVVPSAAWLSELLARCPRTTALVTSRIALDIGGEQRYVVPPLPVPGIGDIQSPAVDLFVERGRAVNVDFAMDVQAAGAVAEICRRLDGLPLAIELAAARVDILPPKALLERLAHQMTALSGRRRDVHARLRSMRDAIQWSYDLLTVEEQRLFRRLTVFDGFTLEAAAFVAGWPDPPVSDLAAMDLVHSLVSQSLVRPADDPVEARFRMLETIREFGVQVGRDLGEEDADRRAHAEYVRSLARRAEPALMGPEQAEWLDRLEAEHPNIRAAMTWLEATGRLDDAIELNAHIKFFIFVRGHTVEALSRLDRWLRDPSLAGRTRSRGLALQMSGGLLQNTGDLERSADMLDEAADILHEVGDRWNGAMAHAILATTYSIMGDLESTREATKVAIELAEPQGLHRFVGPCLELLAWYAEATGDVAHATELRRRAVQIANTSGDLWLQSFHLSDRAEASLRAGDLAEAERRAMQSLALLESLGARRELPWAWGQLARIAHQRDDPELAAAHVDTGLAISRACGHTLMEMELTMQAAVIGTDRGELVRAREELSGALGWFARQSLYFESAQCLAAYASLASRLGDAHRAARFLGASAGVLHRDASKKHLGGLEMTRVALAVTLPAAIGAEAFEREHAEGVALGFDEAVAEALDWAPAMPSPERETPDARAGTAGLSPREMEVLALMAAGCSNQQIADALFVSLRTIATHVTHILSKLDVTSRTAAVAFAIRSGLACNGWPRWW